MKKIFLLLSMLFIACGSDENPFDNSVLSYSANSLDYSGSRCFDLFVTDFDNDGDQDIIPFCIDRSGTTRPYVTMFVNNGEGDYDEKTLISDSYGISGLYMTDYNYDGLSDFIGYRSSTGITKYTNQGNILSSVDIDYDTTYSESDFMKPETPTSFTLDKIYEENNEIEMTMKYEYKCDVNNDGIADYFGYKKYANYGLQLCLSDENFFSLIDVNDVMYNFTIAGCSDLFGNENLELIVFEEMFGLLCYELQDDLTFKKEVLHGYDFSGYNRGDLDVVDMDKDGDNDIVFSYKGDGGENVILALYNEGDGSFSKEVVYYTTGIATQIECTDMNGDNILDIVAVFENVDKGVVIFSK